MNIWLIGAGAIGAVIVAGYGLFKLKASGEWESASGVVIESAIEEISHAPSTRTAGGRIVEYRVNIRYRYTVNGRELTSDTVMAVSEVITAEVGAAITYECQTLPEDIEAAMIELINFWFQSRNRDGTIKSEKIGDWSASYDTTKSMPDMTTMIMSNYRVNF